ncbi:UNVERIFIED_CONTAM: hypothetical protein Slati_2973800 [Sesamum latifolium]|uniref:Uncharacterized protein n=1 Tax=Sesamum latifolium TaxID=2727402 RepID=A0AAW2VF29_9LAMI
MGENRPDDDPFEATSKRECFQSVGPSSGRRKSSRQAAVAFRCLLDEEDEAGGDEEASSPGEEEKVVKEEVTEPPLSMVDWGPSNLKTSAIDQLRREFYIPNSMIIYTPGSSCCPILLR